MNSLSTKKFVVSANFAACGLIVLFVMALALTPHLILSRQVGQAAFFQMGFDEDTYVVYMVSKYFEIGRALSHYIFTAMFVLTGHSVDWTMILADAILPAASAVAAYYLASAVLVSWQGRTLLTMMLLFGQDLLSFANTAVWNERWLLGFRNLFSAGVVPDPTSSYLTILRTPEPQLSYVFIFVLLGLLLRVAKSESFSGAASFAIIVCLSLLLPFTYTYIAFPTLLIAVWIAIYSFFFLTRDLALRLLAIVVVAFAVFVGVTLAKVGAALPIFTTRLPSATPALLVCALLVLPLTIWTVWRHPWERIAWLAISFLVIPIVVSNQQLITGMSISTRDWERNVNYPFLALGVALISTLPVMRSSGFARIFRPAAVGIVLGMAVALSYANKTAMAMWSSSNTPTMFATMQAIEAAEKTRPDISRILVQPAEIVPLLNVRTDNKYDFILNIAKFYKPGGPCCLKPIPAGGVPSISPVETELFEYWWRTGTSPEDAQRIVTDEAVQQGGFYLAYLYSSNDAYAAASDGKHTRTAEILGDIPRAIDRYRRFLESDHANSRVLVLTGQPPSSFKAPRLKSDLIGTGRAGTQTVYAYLQLLEAAAN